VPQAGEAKTAANSPSSPTKSVNLTDPAIVQQNREGKVDAAAKGSDSIVALLEKLEKQKKWLMIVAGFLGKGDTRPLHCIWQEDAINSEEIQIQNGDRGIASLWLRLAEQKYGEHVAVIALGRYWFCYLELELQEEVEGILWLNEELNQSASDEWTDLQPEDRAWLLAFREVPILPALHFHDLIFVFEDRPLHSTATSEVVGSRVVAEVLHNILLSSSRFPDRARCFSKKSPFLLLTPLSLAVVTS